jgi:hypothetical protein
MNQTNFNFIESEKAYATRFFQFPQVLIYGSQYKTLSDSAKLGYMILHDRLDYSLKNNWVDEDNRVYFIFTNQELTDLMGWSKKKVIRVKNGLENQGQLLSFWCRTPQQMRRFIGIILNAKYRVEKDHKDIGVIIPLDDEELKPLMTKALRRYFNALRSDEKHIKNVENYLYGTMQNLFGVWWNKQAAREYAAKHPEEEKSADNDNSGLYY